MPLSEADRAIWQKVKDNHARLDACPHHDFVGAPEHAIPRSGGVLFMRYRCTRCGGEVDNHGHHWYQKGCEHGKAGSG